MSRMFLRQSTQISKSLSYDDKKAAGSNLVSNSESLEDDLNSLRSQVNRILDSSLAGNWYDEIPESWLSGDRRGLRQLGVDLKDLETHTILFRTQKLVDITVPMGHNSVHLSVADSMAPASPIAVAPTNQSGAVAASLLGAAQGGYLPNQVTNSTSHSMQIVPGSSAITPINLCLVVSASTGNTMQVPEDDPLYPKADIYALLQSEAVDAQYPDDGHPIYFDNTPMVIGISPSKRVMLSFVVIDRSGSDPTLVPCPVSAIEGKTINYSYVQRKKFEELSDDFFLDGVFIDAVYDVSGALANSVRLANVIENQDQFGPVQQSDNLILNLIDTKWSFEDSVGAKAYFAIDSNNGSGAVSSDVDTFDIAANTNFIVTSPTSSFSNTFVIDADGTAMTITGSTGINPTSTLSSVGGISLVSQNDLTLQSDGSLLLKDQHGPSYLQLSSNSSDWDAYKGAVGESSILNAISSIKGQRRYDIVISDPSGYVLPPGEVDCSNIGLDFSSIDFDNQINIYLNGQLMRNGSGHDVETGIASNSNLRFNFALYDNDVVTLILPNKS